MTGVLQLLALVVVACLATFLLERGGRLGYGWVTGSEFLVAGLLWGPLGLDLVSATLIRESSVVVLLAASWMGLRAGLKFRKSQLRPLTWRMLLSSQVEPALCLLVLRGLLELSRHWMDWPGSSWRAWLFAAVGAATTKSAAAWARSRHQAKGPLSDAVTVISDLDDLPGILVVGVLFAWIRVPGDHLPPHLWGPLAATVGLALALAVLVRLVMGGGRFRPDLAWIAMLGVCAIAAGTAGPLGLVPLVITFLAGGVLGWISPHADSFQLLTHSSERPVVQVLLLLGGASVRGATGVFMAGLAFAGLRLLTKLVSGAAVGAVLRPSGGAQPRLGVGLLAGGGAAFALALSAGLILPGELGEPLLAGAGAMVLFGDVLGSPALKWLLSRAGELGTPVPGPTVPTPEAFR